MNIDVCLKDRVLKMLEMSLGLIEKPGCWIQASFARDSKGNDISLDEIEKATCFCAEGALMAADIALRNQNPTLDAQIGGLSVYVRARGLVIEGFVENNGDEPSPGFGDIWAWNDYTCQETVVKAYKTAIRNRKVDLNDRE